MTVCVLSSASEPKLAERVEVYAVDALAERLYRLNLDTPSFARDDQQIRFVD